MDHKNIEPMVEKIVDRLVGVLGTKLDIQARRQCTPEQSMRWYQLAYSIQNVLNEEERFREAVYWILVTYLASQRTGYEPGLTENEVSACLLDYLNTIGFAPNMDRDDPEPSLKAQQLIDYFQSELPPSKRNKILDDILPV